MNESPKVKISPAALLQTIKVNLLRRPLWRPQTVEDCLDITRQQLKEKIQSGELAYAFEVGNSKVKSEPRILGLCVVEQQLGPIPAIGNTRNLGLPEVINLILPKRDIRSVELCRLLSLEHKAVHQIAPALVVTCQPLAQDGPNSATVFSRASVARWLSKRRLV